MLQNAYLFLCFYLGITVVFNESYKAVSVKMKSAGALTVLVEFIAGSFSLLFLPFFEMRFPKDPKVYFFLSFAIIFYTIQNRLATTARSGMEASSYSIIKQLSNVFVMMMGFLFFKEELTFQKILGSILLIGSNMLIFYQKGAWKKNRYLFLGIVANLCMGMALFLDVNTSNSFNLAFYVSVTLLFPSILILITERIKIKEITREWKTNSKYLVLLTGISWSLMMVTKLKSYQLGEVTKIAPLCSLTVILNVLFAYLFFKKREDIWKKIISGILITIGVFMIK
ncbi:MAG: DMT family transporter [Bacilli bacterium]|nr:DMT family transporter [Bacilli bacterium]